MALIQEIGREGGGWGEAVASSPFGPLTAGARGRGRSRRAAANAMKRRGARFKSPPKNLCGDAASDGTGRALSLSPPLSTHLTHTHACEVRAHGQSSAGQWRRSIPLLRRSERRGTTKTQRSCFSLLLFLLLHLSSLCCTDGMVWCNRITAAVNSGSQTEAPTPPGLRPPPAAVLRAPCPDCCSSSSSPFS